VNVRALTRDDADAVAALVAADQEARERRPSQLQGGDVLDWWTLVDLERDLWLFAENGAPPAAGWFHVYGDKGMFGGIVGPDVKGRRLGTAVAERAEACARARGIERMRMFIPPEDAAAVALFRGRGYAEVRRFYEMAIELRALPPTPALADGEATITVFGSSSATVRRSRRSSATMRTATAAATSGSSACVARGEPAGSPRRCSIARSRSSGGGARRA